MRLRRDFSVKPGPRSAWSVTLGLAAVLSGCASFSSTEEKKIVRYRFPKGAFLAEPHQAYETLGRVRAKAEFNSLDSRYEEQTLCNNYFNKAVTDLIKIAKKQHADAVIHVESVAFTVDGHSETFPSAQCSDEGEGAQVLVQGIAVKWKLRNGKPIPYSPPVVEPAKKAVPAADKREDLGPPIFAPLNPGDPDPVIPPAPGSAPVAMPPAAAGATPGGANLPAPATP